MNSIYHQKKGAEIVRIRALGGYIILSITNIGA